MTSDWRPDPMRFMKWSLMVHRIRIIDRNRKVLCFGPDCTLIGVADPIDIINWSWYVSSHPLMDRNRNFYIVSSDCACLLVAIAMWSHLQVKHLNFIVAQRFFPLCFVLYFLLFPPRHIYNVKRPASNLNCIFCFSLRTAARKRRKEEIHSSVCWLLKKTEYCFLRETESTVWCTES